MSDKRLTKDKDKSVASASQPALAQMLFAALNEHEAVLSRVSRLLHDEVSQVLSAVGLQLDAMRMDFREQAPGVDARASEIQELLEQAIEQLRDITNELNPSIVERAGLQFALDRLIGKVRAAFPVRYGCTLTRPSGCRPSWRKHSTKSLSARSILQKQRQDARSSIST